MSEDFIYLPIDIENYMEKELGNKSAGKPEWEVLERDCGWKNIRETFEDRKSTVNYCEIDEKGNDSNWNSFDVDDVRKYLEWRYLDEEVDSVMKIQGNYEETSGEFYAVFGYDTDSIEEIEELNIRSPRISVTLLNFENYDVFTGVEHPASHLNDLQGDVTRLTL